MRSRAMLLVLVGCAGCTSSAPPVPDVAQVASIKLDIRAFPKEVGRNDPCEQVLTKQQDLDDVLEWLRSLDWSQAGQDMAVIGLPQPDGAVLISAKDGRRFEFGFFWNGNVVNGKANRLLSGANTAKLRAVALRVCT